MVYDPNDNASGALPALTLEVLCMPGVGRSGRTLDTIVYNAYGARVPAQ